MIKKDSTVYIADGVKLDGEIELKENVGVWYNAVIRADLAKVIVGKNSNIQDLACIHVDKDVPTIIGENVTVGHGAIIHAATIEDNCLIGMGSIILDGATVESGALVAAGCVVPPGKTVPKNTLVVGNPMKIIKELSTVERENIIKNANVYVELAKNKLNER